MSAVRPVGYGIDASTLGREACWEISSRGPAAALGRTRPANLVLIVTWANPIGISAEMAFDTIAVIVEARGP